MIFKYTHVICKLFENHIEPKWLTSRTDIFSALCRIGFHGGFTMLKKFHQCGGDLSQKFKFNNNDKPMTLLQYYEVCVHESEKYMKQQYSILFHHPEYSSNCDRVQGECTENDDAGHKWATWSAGNLDLIYQDVIYKNSVKIFNDVKYILKCLRELEEK